MGVLQQAARRIGALVSRKLAVVVAVFCVGVLAVLIIGSYETPPTDLSVTAVARQSADMPVGEVTQEVILLDAVPLQQSSPTANPPASRNGSATELAPPTDIMPSPVISSLFEFSQGPPVSVDATIVPPAAVPLNSFVPATDVPAEQSTKAPEIQPTEAPQAPTAVPIVPITRLVIPRIDVDAAIEVKGVNPDGMMQTPGGLAIVAWYDFSSQPDEEGNAVFAGHLDYAGYGPAVFWELRNLEIGDVIQVYDAGGTVVEYRVTDIHPFSADDNAGEVVASQGRPTITLITCDGAFDNNVRAYDQRLVVIGDRVD